MRLGQNANNPIIPLFAAQCARSAAEFVKQLAASNSSAGEMIRDKAMAQNIDFLLKTMYPDKKIMVWAHNYHIRHANTQTLVLPSLTPGINVHGEYLVELGRRNDMYTIGLLMYRGSAAANNRQVYDINSVTVGSIESIAYQARKHYLFFDMTSQVRSDSTVWMFEQRVAKEWGVNQLLGVWRNQYDGILFIDAVNPPAYR
jgi:erythromycin esterase